MPELPQSASSDLPAGPKTSAWDQAKCWIEDPVGFWTSCHSEYGDTFTVKFGSQGTTVVFCRPADIRNIFALTEERFVVAPYNEHYGVIMGEQSLLVSDGPDHHEKRRYLSPSFQVSRIPSWIQTLRSQLIEQINGYHVGDEIPMRRMIHVISFDVILQVLFDNEQPEIRKLLRRVFVDHIIKDYGTWSPWARFVKWQPAFRKLFAVEIKRQRTAFHQKDSPSGMFQRLAVMRNEQGEYLSELQIEDQMFTMLVAGVDPSAIATTWAIYWVWQDDLVVDRLLGEQLDRDFSAWVSDTNSYLHACCLESLRMFPVVTTPSGRKLLEPATIGGHRYETGVTLIPGTYLVHRSPNLYEEPDRYLPDRFLNSDYQSYEYFPFGGGNRRCIGAQLALATMKTILAGLIESSRLTLTTQGPIKPVRHGTLLAPSENFRVRLDCLRGEGN